MPSNGHCILVGHETVNFITDKGERRHYLGQAGRIIRGRAQR